MSLNHLETITESIARLSAQLQPVGSESVSVLDAGGRVLAQPLRADRDSPALSVSAMDGYAVRLADLSAATGLTLPVAGVAPAGAPPMSLPSRAAVMIFTGAPIPLGADCVIKREDTLEGAQQMQLQIPLDSLSPGQHIRVQGENIQQQATLLEPGTLIGPAAVAATASFGSAQLQVHDRVRVTVLNTGDELVPPGQPVEAWQIRDSNGPVLTAWLRQLPWVELVSQQSVGDTLQEVRQALEQAIERSDAVLLTGGVSMGNADYVPEAIQQLGGEVVFHRLPLRPGKPVLGAALQGKLLLGLPGNPVSVAVTSRVFGLPLLQRLAGFSASARRPRVLLGNPDDQRLPLVWYRLVTIAEDGQATLCSSRGSGDLVSLALSQGFIEIPPEQAGPGPWPLMLW